RGGRSDPLDGSRHRFDYKLPLNISTVTMFAVHRRTAANNRQQHRQDVRLL
ncbi:hypothetical protein AAVH_24633, partial [Aphelenchoides avenae]